jgi:hypothetical protein
MKELYCSECLVCPCEDCLCLPVCRYLDFSDLFKKCSLIEKFLPCVISYNFTNEVKNKKVREIYRCLKPSKWALGSSLRINGDKRQLVIVSNVMHISYYTKTYNDFRLEETEDK